MDSLKEQLRALPILSIGGAGHLSYQAVTDTVAAFLFPDRPTAEISAEEYAQVLHTADTLCRELGYQAVVKLTPPAVALKDMGLYWSRPAPAGSRAPSPEDSQKDAPVPEQPQDPRLHQLGLDEVTRQHFKIPVVASDGVIDLLHRAVASEWPNDYRGIWHDVLGMCITGGQEVSPAERHFSVIIRGVGQRRYWRMRAVLRQTPEDALYLYIALVEETPAAAARFPLGHVVQTRGAAALEVDFGPYLARHAAGDWGDALDDHDRRANDRALRDGQRILSAYDVPQPDGETERIWIVTEADRSTTTVLKPDEY